MSCIQSSHRAAGREDTAAVQRTKLGSLEFVSSCGRGAYSQVDLVSMLVAAATPQQRRLLCARKTFQVAPPAASGAGAAGGTHASGDQQQGEAAAPPEPLKATSLLDFQREARLHALCAAASPFVLHVFCAKTSATQAVLLLEVARHGPLSRLLPLGAPEGTLAPAGPAAAPHLEVPCVGEGPLRFYVGCVLLALECLHEHSILHRDVKPDNLLLHADGYVALGDLGCATLVPAGQQAASRSGTHTHMAPEVAAATPYSEAADVWSLAVTAFQLAAGRLPVWEGEAAALAAPPGGAPGDASKASGGGSGYRTTCPAHFSQELTQLLGRMLDQDPALRPSLTAVTGSSWYNGFDWAALRGRTMAAPPVPLSFLPGMALN